MVTLIKYGALSGGVKYNANVMFIDGLAAEQKPADKIEGMPIANGSVFTEIDTGKTYMFNAENKTWHEVDLGEGGGGNVYESLEAGTNILIEETADGKAKISASGEVSSEDTVARAAIAAIKDGTNIDSFGDVESALVTKADEDNVYKLALSNADLLPDNTDLDNVKTVGCYYVLAVVTVPTITHRPTENISAFRVTVELAAGQMRPRQIYQEYNSYDKYIRYETSSGTWANWKKVEGDLSTIYTKTEVDTALSGKVDKETSKGLSTNDYTDAEKQKLAGIEPQANKTTVDDALSNSSTNPVQNKVVKSVLDSKANASTTYTKTEVDTALSGKQSALTTAQLVAVDSGIDSDKVEQIATNRAALVEIVNKGAKNLIDAASGSGNRWTDISCNLPAGEYVLSFGELSTTWTSPTNTIQIGFFNETYASVTSEYVYIDLETKVLKVTTLDTAKIIRVYASPTSITGETITYRNAMVCTQAAWNISQAYQPYTMSNAELTKNEVIDRAALVEIIDNGTKNLYQYPSESAASESYTWINKPINLSPGTYVLSFGSLTSSSSDTKCQVVCFDSSNGYASGWLHIEKGNNISGILEVTKSTATIRIYAGDSAASSVNQSMSYTDGMVCSKAAWDISQAYQPYRPNYDELIARIEALENV